MKKYRINGDTYLLTDEQLKYLIKMVGSLDKLERRIKNLNDWATKNEVALTSLIRTIEKQARREANRKTELFNMRQKIRMQRKKERLDFKMLPWKVREILKGMFKK